MDNDSGSAGSVVVQGVVGGLVGGILFAAVEVATSLATGRSVADPFRVIASMLLGQGALSPGSPWDSAASTGLAMHFVLSVIYGLVLVGGVALFRGNQIPRLMYLLVGIVYAIALWIINFVVVAPGLLPQSGLESAFQLGFALAHPAYGLGLGTYLAAVRRERESGAIPGRP